LTIGLSPGFEGIPLITGPMGRNIADLKFIMKLLLNEDLTRFDATVTPNPWNDDKFAHYATKKKLKFGYYFDDGVTISSPPVKRAIERTVTALAAQGHEVELIVPPNVVEAVRIFIALTSNSSSAPCSSSKLELTCKVRGSAQTNAARPSGTHGQIPLNSQLLAALVSRHGNDPNPLRIARPRHRQHSVPRRQQIGG